MSKPWTKPLYPKPLHSFSTSNMSIQYEDQHLSDQCRIKSKVLETAGKAATTVKCKAGKKTATDCTSVSDFGNVSDFSCHFWKWQLKKAAPGHVAKSLPPVAGNIKH